MSHEIADFEKDVLERSRTTPVLVDFWADWCAPCRALGPVLERLADEAGGRWVLAKVDTERHPNLAERFGIRGIPNVKLFMGGEIVDEFAGALPEAEVRRWLERALPSPQAALVAQAKALIDGQGFEAAAEMLRRVLEAEPGREEARLLLARALLHLNPAAVADALHGVDAGLEQAEALGTLARVAAWAGQPEALPAAAVKPRFLDGARGVLRGDWDAALEAFIEVLRADRGYADGAAKDAGRAIFVLLGIQHPACERHHRAFSSALHV